MGGRVVGRVHVRRALYGTVREWEGELWERVCGKRRCRRGRCGRGECGRETCRKEGVRGSECTTGLKGAL